jgi:hypothetical protein
MKKGLLFGAGFSYNLGMPLSYELADVQHGDYTSKWHRRTHPRYLYRTRSRLR